MPSTWLADALRAGGCRVDETVVPDWKSRGHTDGPRLDAPVGVLGHHTAGGASGDLPSLKTVRDGRPDLGGPLANLMLSRAGVWVPIAAGRAWHAGAADSPAKWPWVPKGDGNGYLIGIEAESSGTGDWTPAQLAAYPQGVAALLRHLGRGADRFLGHKEWAPSRKPDPAKWPGDMNGFRTTVTSILNGDTDMALSDEDVQKLMDWGMVTLEDGRVVGFGELLKAIDRNGTTTVQQLTGLTTAVSTLAEVVASGRDDLTAQELEEAVDRGIQKGGAAVLAAQQQAAAAGRA